MESKKYEVLIGEGSEGLIPMSDELEDGSFTYSCLEHLEFSEVMMVLEMFRKQTYRPLISIREENPEE